MSSSQQMDSISATGRARQKYDQSCCQHFSNGRISLKNRARFDSRALALFYRKVGRAVRAGERGCDERTGLGERQPGCDMKNELFSVLFFALFGVPLLSKKQKVLSSKTVSSVSACNRVEQTKTKSAWPGLWVVHES